MCNTCLPLPGSACFCPALSRAPAQLPLNVFAVFAPRPLRFSDKSV